MLLQLTRRVRAWAWLSTPLALVACALAGCGGGPEGKVEGRVTLAGAPVPEGTVVMFTEGPDPFSGITGADGKFTTSKPVKVGNYLVAVQQRQQDQGEVKYGPEGKTAQPDFESVIPEKYRVAATSGVKFEVKAGDNKFTLEMSDQPAAEAPAPDTGYKGKGSG